MLINSFKYKFDIYTNPFWLPPQWDFSSYQSVFADSQFFRYFQNSLLVTIVSIGLILFFASLAGYAFVNWRTRLARWLYYFFLAGMMLPIRIGSISLLTIVKNLGLINSIYSLPPVYIAMGMPIAILILTEFIRSIPQELSEAAFMDGAPPRKIYWTIILPLLRPAFGTVAIFNLVPIWNDLWFPLIFINAEKQKTLILGVTRLFGQYQTDWSKILAVLSLSAVPVMLLYLLMSKQFIRGLTAGAIKS